MERDNTREFSNFFSRRSIAQEILMWARHHHGSRGAEKASGLAAAAAAAAFANKLECRFATFPNPESIFRIVKTVEASL